jgi:parallel beta-helix repeat protein
VYGIYLYDSDGTQISGNYFYQNTQDGVSLSLSDYCSITGNDIDYSTSAGVDMVNSHVNYVSDNQIDGGTYGVYLYGSDYNDMVNNEIWNAGNYATYVLSSDENDYLLNDFHDNDRGVFVSSAVNTEFYDNRVCDSTYQDFYIATSAPSTSGDRNHCDSVYNYADDGQTSGCDFGCGGCPYTCGDIDGSGGAVDLGDFSFFALCFGFNGPNDQCPEPYFSCSDMNGDGLVNLADFGDFANWFGLISGLYPPNCADSGM